MNILAGEIVSHVQSGEVAASCALAVALLREHCGKKGGGVK